MLDEHVRAFDGQLDGAQAQVAQSLSDATTALNGQCTSERTAAQTLYFGMFTELSVPSWAKVEEAKATWRSQVDRFSVDAKGKADEAIGQHQQVVAALPARLADVSSETLEDRQRSSLGRTLRAIWAGFKAFATGLLYLIAGFAVLTVLGIPGALGLALVALAGLAVGFYHRMKALVAAWGDWPWYKKLAGVVGTAFAAVGDFVGLTGGLEAVLGHEAVTGRELSRDERIERFTVAALTAITALAAGKYAGRVIAAERASGRVAGELPPGEESNLRGGEESGEPAGQSSESQHGSEDQSAKETKPAETKPAETKPDTKPAESKPTEPAETKPTETKPTETKPTETKVAETRPEETTPVETKPAGTTPAETTAVETTAVETTAVETTAAETNSAETNPAETKPAENKRPQTEATQAKDSTETSTETGQPTTAEDSASKAAEGERAETSETATHEKAFANRADGPDSARTGNLTPDGVDAAAAKIRSSGRLRGDPGLFENVVSKAKTGDEGALGEIEAIARSIAEGREVEVLPEQQNARGVRNPDHRVSGKLREVKTSSKTDGDRTVSRKISDANNQIKNSGLKDPEGAPETGDADIQLRGDSAKIPFKEIEREVRRQFNTGRSRSLDRVRVFVDGELAGEWVRQPDGSVTRAFPADVRGSEGATVEGPPPNDGSETP